MVRASRGVWRVEGASRGGGFHPSAGRRGARRGPCCASRCAPVAPHIEGPTNQLRPVYTRDQLRLNQWGINEQSTGNQRQPMDNPWAIHGQSMGNKWAINGNQWQSMATRFRSGASRCAPRSGPSR
eukprot:3945927-Prymnesium_polylepis.1